MPDIVADFPALSCFHLNSEAESMNFKHLLLIPPHLARA
jgi:hypothetical protein